MAGEVWNPRARAHARKAGQRWRRFSVSCTRIPVGRYPSSYARDAPLHPETEHLFDDTLIAKMKRGAYIVNTAPGQDLRPRCDRAGTGNTVERSGQPAHAARDGCGSSTPHRLVVCIGRPI
jgi:hypothetical protein